MPAALLELGPLLLGLVCLALATILTVLVYALFHPLIAALQAIPVIGGRLAGPFKAIESAVLRALGAAEHKVDALIGWSWHLLAKQANWLWREVKRHGLVALQVATLTYSIVDAYHRLRHLVHSIRHVTTASSGAIKRLEKEYHGIEHRVKSLERAIAKGIGHDLRIRVAGLEEELGRVEGKTIPAIRSRVASVEHDIGSLRKWVTDNVPLIGTAAFAGAVAWALSNLGLGWLRCNSNPFNNNKRACGLWDDLAGLLGLATLALAATDFEELVKAMQEVEDDVTKGLYELLNL
jgi:hypothetical protein